MKLNAHDLLLKGISTKMVRRVCSGRLGQCPSSCSRFGQPHVTKAFDTERNNEPFVALVAMGNQFERNIRLAVEEGCPILFAAQELSACSDWRRNLIVKGDLADD